MTVCRRWAPFASAATLLLADLQSAAQSDTSTSQVVAPTAAQEGQAITFEHRCKSPELPLNGAPLPALSLGNPGAAPFPELPHHARPGTTKLDLLVNEQGRVVKARVATSHGDPRVDTALLQAMERWRFKPRYLDAKAVCAWGSYAVKIVFEDEGAAKEPAASTAPRDRQ